MSSEDEIQRLEALVEEATNEARKAKRQSNRALGIIYEILKSPKNRKELEKIRKSLKDDGYDDIAL